MRAQPPEAVLFDAGGTLVQPEGDRIAAALAAFLAVEVDPLATRLALARATRAFDERHWATGEPLPAPSLVRMLLEELGVAPDKLDAAAEIMLGLAVEDPGIWNAPIPGARATVLELKARGFRVGVVSNSDGRVAAHLDRAGIGSDLFEVVVDSQEVGVEKPDPAIFRIALQRLRLDASDCVYVGDVWFYDVMGAREAGMDAVLIDPQGAYDALPGRDDHVSIPDVTGLLTLPWLA